MCGDLDLVAVLPVVLQEEQQEGQLYAPKARSHPDHKDQRPQQQPLSFYNCTSLLGRQRMSVVGPLGQLPPARGAA
jgi:hypothetical protein